MMFCPNCGKQSLSKRILAKEGGKTIKYFNCDECKSKYFIRKIKGMIM